MNLSRNRTERSRMMLGFSFCLAFLLHLLLFSVAPMVTVLIETMNITHAQFGFIFSSAMISLILFRLPWGFLADRVGYVKVVKISLLLSTVFAMARAFASGYSSLILSQFFVGLGMAALMPCLSLMVKEWSIESPGFSTGVYVSGFAAGNATALGLTPHLLGLMDWRGVFLVYAGFSAVVCAAWLCLAEGRAETRSAIAWKDLERLVKDKYVWVLLLFLVASMGCYDTLATWMPRVLDMKQFSSALASLLPLGFFVAGPVVGLLSDQVQNRTRVVWPLGMMAAASIVGINHAPFPVLLVCLFLVGFTTTGVTTITLAVPVKHKRLSPVAGSVVGLISSLGNIGPLLMPVLFGFLIDVTGTYHASVFSVAALAGFVVILGSRVSE